MMRFIVREFCRILNSEYVYDRNFAEKECKLNEIGKNDKKKY